MEKLKQEVEQKVKALDKSCSYKLELSFDENGELCDVVKVECSGTQIGTLANTAQLYILITSTVFQGILKKAEHDSVYKANWLCAIKAVKFATQATIKNLFDRFIKELEGVNVNEKATAPQEVAQEEQG